MDKIRRKEINKLNVQLKSLRKFNERDTETIGRYRNMKYSEFNINKISELKDKITDREMEIQNLEKRIQNINIGLIDTELQNEINKTTVLFLNKKEKSQTKKLLDKKNKDEDKKKSLNYYKNNRKQYVNYDKEYKFFLKKCSSLPKHLSKNLKNMPNNKGYIFKNIYFYGKKKPFGNIYKDRLYERKNGELYVHEIYNKKHHIIKQKKEK
jgi:chromosome segregation ATPase